MVHLTTTNDSLETLLNAVDPFAKSEDTGVEESGYEDDFSRATR